jgi:F0F1-type ATP synthase assembly protein I
MTDDGARKPDDQEPTKEEIEDRLERLFWNTENEAALTDDEVERELEGINERIEESRPQDLAFDAEFEERLSQVEQRAKAAKVKREAEKRQQETKFRAEQSDARGLGAGLSIAYVLIGLPLAGAALGWFLDRNTGANTWQATLVLLGAVGGLVMAFVILGRTNKRE